jgi:hypothetical protein
MFHAGYEQAAAGSLGVRFPPGPADQVNAQVTGSRRRPGQVSGRFPVTRLVLRKLTAPALTRMPPPVAPEVRARFVMVRRANSDRAPRECLSRGARPG